MSRTIFIGSVLSSKIALEALLDNNIEINLVCALDEIASQNVSDYYPIHEIAEYHHIPYVKFTKINQEAVVQAIKKIEADYIFVIGLSQIVSAQILDMAKVCAIGFHPTSLPKYRGRAAIPWQIILGIKESHVTLFALDKGMDSGDIICQESYQIEECDYAMDVYLKICETLKVALNKYLHGIYDKSLLSIKQNEEEATYLLARRMEDGLINWQKSAKEILTLIRATSKPYPGAFSYYKNKKIIIWRAYIEKNNQFIGLPGQIAQIDSTTAIKTMTEDDLIVVTEYEIDGENIKIVVGNKFEQKCGE